MSLGLAETILRWLGGFLAYASLAIVLYGIWRGTRRPAGRTSGRAASWLRSAVFYFLATAGFLAFSVYFWKPLPLNLPPGVRLALLIAGSLLYFPGIALVLWGRLALGKMYFVSTSFGAQLYADHRLVTSGPFSIVRHPMYLGLVTAALGSLLLYQAWTTLAYVLFAPFVLRRASREELALSAEFGNAWQEYSQRVPALLPRLIKQSRAHRERISEVYVTLGQVLPAPAKERKEMTLPDLQGVARTLLVPLACRAIESPRPDAIIHDPRAVQVYNALGGNRDFLMGMHGHDLFASVMRVRQFDTFARNFIARNPGGVILDLGCGLDTRFDRLDDGHLTWLGVDLPEVIRLRHQYLPDSERCRTIARSMFDISWLDEVAELKRPVIFLAEGVFPYFSTAELKPLLVAMARRFPNGELVFDALSPLMVWIHNHESSVLKRSGTAIRWDAKDPAELKAWGLHLLERWGYFSKPEPRLGGASLIRLIPPLANSTYILHYQLGDLKS